MDDNINQQKTNQKDHIVQETDQEVIIGQETNTLLANQQETDQEAIGQETAINIS